MAKTLVLAVVVAFLALIKIHDAATVTNLQLKVFDAYKTTYYNPLTNATLVMEIENGGRLPFTRLGFRSLPCACHDLSCGCCAGINITRIQFDQKACTNFTYDPHKFAIKMEVAMNDNKVFENQISARNPPPICVPFPYIPAIDFCVRFHSVSMPGNNLQACIDFETRVIQSPVMVLHFDCIRIGADGVSWVKPEDSQQGIDNTDPSYGNLPISGPEEYDEVNFEISNGSELITSNNSTLSPEDEDKIGQLKL